MSNNEILKKNNEKAENFDEIKIRKAVSRLELVLL